MIGKSLGGSALGKHRSDVLGYTADVSAHATVLAIASSFGMKRCFGSSTKALGVGLSARAGFEAAILAQSGHTGPFGILEDTRGLLTLRNVNAFSEPDYGRQCPPISRRISLRDCFVHYIGMGCNGCIGGARIGAERIEYSFWSCDRRYDSQRSIESE
ncbi:MmgE/PrpD family protein [Rhizobium rhizogenes]|nr:hypothetical protein DXT98_20190 [Agrobacterium sp. ICMP 7243]MQB31935.1 hypothetical protein [Rhizobium rhizogenes]NTF50083.1 MmgE/PrpD family protein [Rhizobium rhizogenes]NTF63099.1 MmgE/PrpD family protein [Rhizobium rhizogenes]NTF69775.1 MmgE/PrpD family protein [Rhizobium rhizogenes]